MKRIKNIVEITLLALSLLSVWGSFFLSVITWNDQWFFWGFPLGILLVAASYFIGTATQGAKL